VTDKELQEGLERECALPETDLINICWRIRRRTGVWDGEGAVVDRTICEA
jgi:hypothetical protein